jgi:hypothetical protein
MLLLAFSSSFRLHDFTSAMYLLTEAAVLSAVHCVSSEWTSIQSLNHIQLVRKLALSLFVWVKLALWFFFCLWLYSPLELDRFFSSLIYAQSVGFLGRGISPLLGRYLHTEQTDTDIHASSGFEPTIPAFQRAKTIHALDCAATVIGSSHFSPVQ